MCENIDTSLYGTQLPYKIHQAWNNQSCGQAEGRPYADPRTGLCADAQGRTGAEFCCECGNSVVGVGCCNKRRGGELRSWRWTSSAAKQCSPTVPDAFNQNQQVANPFYCANQGTCTQRGYMACVDGLCVPGCPRKATMPVPDASCCSNKNAY